MGTKNLLVNQDCIVRDRPCNRVFGASNICFIACPSTDEVALELEILKNVLFEVELDPYVAVENFEPAKDIFCTKICTKIIESKLCIALLSGSVDGEGMVLPNPNVYYEYGLMTGWAKPTIPMQRSDQRLAFNIQSLDTVKYSSRDFKNRIFKAIQMTLMKMEKQGEEKRGAQTKGIISFYMDMLGNSQSKNPWSVDGTDFMSFQNFQFASMIFDVTDRDRLRYEMRMILRRLENLLSVQEIKKMRIEDELKLIKKQHVILKWMQEQSRLERQLESIKNPTFILVLCENTKKTDFENIFPGETILKPEIICITLDEIKKHIEKS
jgi:hypothetical protein